MSGMRRACDRHVRAAFQRQPLRNEGVSGAVLMIWTVGACKRARTQCGGRSVHMISESQQRSLAHQERTGSAREDGLRRRSVRPMRSRPRLQGRLSQESGVRAGRTQPPRRCIARASVDDRSDLISVQLRLLAKRPSDGRQASQRIRRDARAASERPPTDVRSALERRDRHSRFRRARKCARVASPDVSTGLFFVHGRSS